MGVSFRSGRHRALPLCVGVAFACVAPWAHAALGDTVQSVAADRMKLHATSPQSRTAVGYTVQEMTLPSGTVVREFVSAAGTVFGVAWQGPAPPDLQQLLGRYFPGYVAAPRGPHGRGYARTEAGSLVVENTGHTGAMHGHAYLIDGLPAGVDPAAIW